MGEHWVVASEGIFDTRIKSLGLVDEKGDHVFCAVPNGIYETTDAAASWALVNGSEVYGTCYTFKNGSIGGEPYIFAGCDAGIANYAVKTGEWRLIPPGGWGRAGYLTQSDAGPNTVLGGCLDGVVTIGEVTSPTTADWTSFKERPCTMLGAPCQLLISVFSSSALRERGKKNPLAFPFSAREPPPVFNYVYLTSTAAPSPASPRGARALCASAVTSTEQVSTRTTRITSSTPTRQ